MNNIKYVYFDLDGTLLKNNNEISKANLEAITHLRQKGMKIGIATGRNFLFCLNIIDKIKPDLPIISINGNLIYDPIKKVKLGVKPLPKDSVVKVLAYAKKHKINFLLYSSNKIYTKFFTKSIYKTWLDNIRKNQSNKYKVPFLDYNNQDFNTYKIIFEFINQKHLKETEINKFVDGIEGLYTIKAFDMLIEIMPEGISKASGLQYVEKKGLIELEKTIVFGDSYNDIEMFNVAKISVAMKNANQHLKNKATHITNYDNVNNGIFHFVKKNF